MKRAFDFSLALFGLLISAPLWVIFGLAIWLKDGRPIFYVQERVGKDGEIFKGLKFRSMIKDAETIGPVQARENDIRITKIGRILRITALDELPQLWNILRGDMSFVGPRALRPVEVDTDDGKPYAAWEFEGFKERSMIRPGLTGIAQILTARDVPRSEKFRYDIWYVKNQNFWLDIKVIVLSFCITFLAKWEVREKRFRVLAKRLHFKVTREIGEKYDALCPEGL